MQLSKLARFIHNLNDEKFIQSLDETRQRFQWWGYFFLGFMNLPYILVDRGLMPDHWTDWQFLGTRLAVSFSTWIFMLHPVWRRSQAGLYVPGTLLFFGMASMTHVFPEDRLIEVYQGISMVFAAYTLITFVKLKHYLLYVAVIFASYFSIWLVNPPSSFDYWMSKCGFANFSTLILATIGFYIFRLQLSFLNYSLLGKLRERNQQIEEHRFRLESILKALPQAVLLIDLAPDQSSLTVTEGFSAELETLFGQNYDRAYDPIRRVFAACDLNDDQLSQINSILMNALKDDLLAWELNRHALPIALNLRQGDKVRNLQLDWAAVQELDGSVGKILVSIKDATELQALHQNMFQQTLDSRRIIEIIAVDRDKLRDFFSLARNLMDESAEILRPTLLSPSMIHAVFRNMHTLKGLARAYNLNDLTQVVHEAENSIVIEKKALDASQRRAIVEQIPAIIAVIDAYEHLMARLYTVSEKNHGLAIDQTRLEHISNQILPGIVRHDLAGLRESVLSLRRLYSFNLERILVDEVLMTKEIAVRLNKNEPVISFHNDNYQIADFMRTPFRKAFVHIFRNSIDHGIESMDQRLRAGKTPEGSIRIAVEAQAVDYKIYIEDDGCGLNITKIRERAQIKDMLDPHHSYSTREIAEFIFALGISTSDIDSEISGRGVGMDAVRTFLRSHGCAIEIELLGPAWNKDHYHFRFVISVPGSYLNPIISDAEEAMLLRPGLPVAS
jgi:PAS domain-containing protein